MVLAMRPKARVCPTTLGYKAIYLVYAIFELKTIEKQQMSENHFCFPLICLKAGLDNSRLLA